MITDYKTRHKLEQLSYEAKELHEKAEANWKAQVELARVYFYKMKILDEYFQQINNGEAL